ncbi:uncharacterized protein G2W53_032545 [Senna tora]|uniref:Uncharacterized protein n=1 Tax=Senna tora TaxID=362788 RepID=A0A834SWX0_9FABA|nr:uncharacterized protein G2W53_032545 [Senna tora]
MEAFVNSTATFRDMKNSTTFTVAHQTRLL